MKKQVFIVEGQHDAAKLKEVLGQIEVIVTNGSAIDDKTLHLIKTLDNTHQIIVFTDPDYAGQRIRHIVSKDLKHVHHAFLKQELAISKNHKKVGIEHADKEDILYALKHIQIVTNEKHAISTHFLFDCGLIGQEHSKQLRDQLSGKLHLGHVNGKTLKMRLELFNITEERIKEVMNESST